MLGGVAAGVRTGSRGTGRQPGAADEHADARRPLYYYHRDRGPGDTTGQHVTDAWGARHLLSPSGEPIRPADGY